MSSAQQLLLRLALLAVMLAPAVLADLTADSSIEKGKDQQGAHRTLLGQCVDDDACLGRTAGWSGYTCNISSKWCTHSNPRYQREVRACCRSTRGLCTKVVAVVHKESLYLPRKSKNTADFLGYLKQQSTPVGRHTFASGTIRIGSGNCFLGFKVEVYKAAQFPQWDKGDRHGGAVLQKVRGLWETRKKASTFDVKTWQVDKDRSCTKSHKMATASTRASYAGTYYRLSFGRDRHADNEWKGSDRGMDRGK